MQELEQALRDLVFKRDPAWLVGIAKERQLVYRRLIHNNLYDVIISLLPLTYHFAGAEKFRQWIATWLEEQGPKQRMYWMIPVEFAAWLMENIVSENLLLAELAHFEAMQQCAENAPNTHLSCKLGIYYHSVHLISDENSTLPLKLERPIFLLIYRADETVRWLEIEPQVAQLLAKLAEGASLKESLDSLSELYADLDRAYLTAQLAGLSHRGLVSISETHPRDESAVYS